MDSEIQATLAPRKEPPVLRFAEKSFLVTGGTGSFGNFIVHRLLSCGAREVRVLVDERAVRQRVGLPVLTV